MKTPCKTFNISTPTDKTLYPFQVSTIYKTLKFLATNESGSAYVANEQGLGKTPTTIVTSYALESTKTLVICPAVMRLTWEREIYAWCPPSRSGTRQLPKVQVVLSADDVTSPEGRLALNSASWVICSYDLASRPEVLQALATQSYSLLVLDEAHYIKNRTAKRTKAVFGSLWAKAKYHILLSGTPMTRNVVDCFTPFHNILPSTFPKFQIFAETYSYHRNTNWGVDFYGLKNAEQLSELIRNEFYIRFRKEDVLTELPEKIFQKITLPPSYSVHPDAKHEQEIEAEQRKVIDALVHGRSVPVPASLAEHRRLQGVAKVPAVVDYAENLLDQDRPVIIFAHHKSVIAAIAEKLKAYAPVVITGETSAELRANYIDAFQSGLTKLIICNFMAGGIGTTMTAGSDVLLAELDWSPATIAQAVDRAHRIGQKNQVVVHWFCVVDSIDEQMSELIMKRAQDFKKLFDNNSSEALTSTQSV